MRTLRAVFGCAVSVLALFSAAVVAAQTVATPQPYAIDLMIKECAERGAREIPKATTIFDRLRGGKDYYSRIISPARTEQKLLAAAKVAAANCINSKIPNETRKLPVAGNGVLGTMIYEDATLNTFDLPTAATLNILNWIEDEKTGAMALLLFARFSRRE